MHGLIGGATRALGRGLRAGTAVAVLLVLLAGVGTGIAFAAPSTGGSDGSPSLGQIALLVTAIFGGIAAILGSIVTYVLGKRKSSGGVHTAEAETIFQAAEQLREEQRGEVVALRAEVLSLRQEIISLRAEIVRLRDESARLRLEADGLRSENTMVKMEAVRLRKTSEETSAALAALDRDMTIMKHMGTA